MNTSPPNNRVLLGITGASGIIYGRLLLREMVKLGLDIHLIVSPSAVLVMREELRLDMPKGGFDPAALLGEPPASGQITVHDDSDLTAPPASGTFRSRGMIICPCSMKTLGMIASGTGATLICRAAEACLKERRRLVLVPRETPLNLVQLRNMVAVTEAGAIVAPAMPGFYHRPKDIDSLALHLIMKVLDLMHIEHSIRFRWKDPE